MNSSKIGIIGFGRAGRLLFQIFKKTPICFDVKREQVPDEHYSDFRSLISDSSVIFIAVPDDKISVISREIAESGIGLEKKIFIHLSGANPSAILSSIKDKRGGILALHPALSIVDIDWIIKNLKKFIWTVEGTKSEKEKIRNLFRKYSVKVFPISGKDKGVYHLGCVFLSNIPVFNPVFGSKLLRETGLAENVVCKLGRGLILSVEHNLRKFPHKNIITGPLIREDVNTLKKHFEILKNKEEMMAWYIIKCKTIAEKYNLKKVMYFLKEYS